MSTAREEHADKVDSQSLDAEVTRRALVWEYFSAEAIAILHAANENQPLRKAA